MRAIVDHAFYCLPRIAPVNPNCFGNCERVLAESFCICESVQLYAGIPSNCSYDRSNGCPIQVEVVEIPVIFFRDTKHLG